MVNHLRKFIGYYTLVCIIYGCVRTETVCLHDDVVIRWDLEQYKDIAYAYLQHEGELIVSFGSPNNFIIHEEFNKKVDLDVTDTWLVEMTVHNISYRDNGTYTCTVGIIGEKEITMNKDLTIIDPDVYINLYITEDDKCRTVNCVSNYYVTLLGPETKEIKNNTCLPHMETGIYSCCFLNPVMCPSDNCRYIDVRWTTYTTATTTVLGTEDNKEITERFTSMNVEMNQQNTGVIIGCVVGVIVLLVVVLIVVIVIKLRKKANCKLKETLKDKEQEESCLQNQGDDTKA